MITPGMLKALERKIRDAMEEAFFDLEAIAVGMGCDGVEWESLADYAADRMHWDKVTEYTEMPYEERRALVERIAKQLA